MKNKINELENKLNGLLENLRTLKSWAVSKDEAEAYSDHWKIIAQLEDRIYAIEDEISSLEKLKIVVDSRL